MNDIPPNDFRHRLAALDRQIHNSLKVIRQHLSELEKAAQPEANNDKKAEDFATVLKRSLGSN